MASDRIANLLSQFPGPVTIRLSISRLLLLGLGGAAAFIGIGWWLISFREPFAQILATGHGTARGAGVLYVLIWLRVARNMPEAIAEFGFISMAFGTLGGLAAIRFLVAIVRGGLSLTLNREGFVIRGFGKRVVYQRWQDVGDFDSARMPWGMPPSMKCLVFNDYRAPESPLKSLTRIGRNRSLRFRYEYPPEDLAVLISVWRERALEANASKRS